MTRHSFGGGTADFVQEVDNQGIVHAGNGATCTFFTAQTGGTAITDLTDLANNPITSVSADANGGVPSFMGPNDGTSAMWVSGGGSARQLMQATDIPARIIALETSGIGGGGTVTSVNGVSPVSGAVTLVPSDIGADPAGAAATAQANAEAASDPVGAATSAATTAQANAEAASFSLTPVQRGVWAPTTAYAHGDIVVSPTGDIITPKTPFTSGASYSVINWNILVPAQNYGRELTAAESSADLNLLSTAGAWTDVPGMTGTIPAGIPFVAEITAICASLQGTAAAGALVDVQLRLVDSATTTTVYAFAWKQFYFPVAGQSATQWGSVATFRRQAALGASTAVKLQATTAVVTNAGNRGIFPASGGSTEPTTFMVRGR